jgi:hypothetical protein
MISHKLTLTSVTAPRVFTVEGKQIVLSLTAVRSDFPVIASNAFLLGSDFGNMWTSYAEMILSTLQRPSLQSLKFIVPCRMG